MKKTVKIITVMLCVIGIATMTGCKKDEESNKEKATLITIKNLSGKDFYGCKAIFWSVENIADYEVADIYMGEYNCGNIKMGESCKVEKKSDYFYISAKDENGKSLLSFVKKAYDGVTFYSGDVF